MSAFVSPALSSVKPTAGPAPPLSVFSTLAGSFPVGSFPPVAAFPLLVASTVFSGSFASSFPVDASPSGAGVITGSVLGSAAA